MTDVSFTVTAGTDRQSRADQIAEVLARVRAKGEPVRVRLPFTLYDYADARSYVFLRDATWNLQLPGETTTPEAVEALIHALGVCIVAIATHGSGPVEAALAQVGQPTDTPAPDVP